MKASIQRYPSELPLPFSKVVRAGGFLFLSGQVALDTQGNPLTGDITEQTHAVLDSIRATLAEHRASLADVVRVTVWLADLQQFPAFNRVYAEYFGAALPARSTVQAQLAHGAAIEVEVQAFVGDADGQ
jgi:reactive intermediate/imine deaminase